MPSSRSNRKVPTTMLGLPLTWAVPGPPRLGHAFRGVMPIPPATGSRVDSGARSRLGPKTKPLPGLQGAEGALVRRVGYADRVFEARTGGARSERHRTRLHALVGQQPQKGELGGTERESLRPLHFDRAAGGRELPRGDDRDSEAVRGLDRPETPDLEPRRRHHLTPFTSYHILYFSLTISFTYHMSCEQARATDRAHSGVGCAGCGSESFRTGVGDDLDAADGLIQLCRVVQAVHGGSPSAMTSPRFRPGSSACWPSGPGEWLNWRSASGLRRPR